MTTFIDITEDEFDATYQLKPNHLNPNASWGFDDGPGCLFDTSPEELAFVHEQDPRTIWTFLDGDDGKLYLISGYHYVNRIGYLISTVAVPDDVVISCHIPTSDDEEDAQDD